MTQLADRMLPFRASRRCLYRLGGGVLAGVSHVVGGGPQVHFLGGHAPLSRRRCFRGLDDGNALGGGDGLLLVFVFLPRLSIVERTVPVLLVVTANRAAAYISQLCCMDTNNLNEGQIILKMLCAITSFGRFGSNPSGQKFHSDQIGEILHA